MFSDAMRVYLYNPAARRLPASVSFLMAALLGAAVALLSLTGCGRGGRDQAREQIKQARQPFNADGFIKAAAAGDRALVETFLRAGMDRNIGDLRGYTALMAAAEAGKPVVVKMLLDENAKPDLQNQDGASALVLAAAANQPESVRALIEGNADVRVRDQKNWTALMKAVFLGHSKVVDVLLTTSRDQLARDGQLDRALAVAAVLGQNETVRALLDRGANINAAIENKQTALMYAATAGKRDTVQLLLQRGADVRMVDAEGATASILALQRGYPDLAKLIDASAPGGVPGSPAASPVAVAAASPASTPAASSKPPLTEEQAKQAAAEAASMALERTWLKENGIEPTKLLNKDTGQDEDKDGFTDDEELANGTDPHDPKSHPPYSAKLRMKKFTGEPFPVMFDGMEGKKARVSVWANGGEVRKAAVGKGERVPDLPYAVSAIRPRNVTEKDSGKPVDASELTLSNVETGEKIVLVRAMPASGANASALLSTGYGGPEIEVKNGQQFTLPQDEKTRYQVIDIRPTQVVIKALNTGQTITVPIRAE
jgi:ankyrin repeat protein